MSPVMLEGYSFLINLRKTVWKFNRVSFAPHTFWQGFPATLLSIKGLSGGLSKELNLLWSIYGVDINLVLNIKHKRELVVTYDYTGMWLKRCQCVFIARIAISFRPATTMKKNAIVTRENYKKIHRWNNITENIYIDCTVLCVSFILNSFLTLPSHNNFS